jgi:MoaA/NifB/PqqE/SkfB family radical SAM enzyme
MQRLVRSLTGMMTQPDIIQLDTTQRCNARCVYCNPQRWFGLTGEDMNLETAENVLGKVVDAGWAERILEYRPYINGEPTLHPELKKFVELGRRYLPNAKIIILTNGIDVSNLPLDVDVISFTISAGNRETYKKVHGVDQFVQVLINLYQVLKEKSDKTVVHASFVANRYNYPELNIWKHFTFGAVQDVSPIHFTSAQKASEVAMSLNNDEIIHLATVCTPMKLQRWRACNCFNNMSIGVHGELLTCCDLDYTHNSGNILDDDLEELWINRCRSVFRDSQCLSCNLRRPDFAEICKRY